MISNQQLRLFAESHSVRGEMAKELLARRNFCRKLLRINAEGATDEEIVDWADYWGGDGTILELLDEDEEPR